MGNTVLAWHFAAKGLFDRPALPLPVNEAITRCGSEFDWSVRVIEALNYNPGNILCRIEMGSPAIEQDGGKLVFTSWTILWRMNVKSILSAFARHCALDVGYMWEMPAVVREYLETGNEKLRPDAEGAAWAASWDSARFGRVDRTVRNAMDAAYHAARKDVAFAAHHAAIDAASATGNFAAKAVTRECQNTTLTNMVMAQAAERGYFVDDVRAA